MTTYVYIIERKTGKVVKRMGPMSERTAEQVERGVNINLNHEDYVVVVSRDKVKEGDTVHDLS